MKAYAHNPRQITAKRFSRLQDTLQRLGDLSGIVLDLNTDQIVGGHQRIRAMLGEEAGEFKVSESDLEITERYAQPDAQGTVTHGFILWHGFRYAYREVRYTDEQFQEANIAANLGAGAWDWAELANSFEIPDLVEWGFDFEQMRDFQISVSALGNLLGSNQIDYEKEWEGMPEFENENNGAMKSIIVHFMSQSDVDDFAELIEQNITDKTKSLWYPKKEHADLLALVAHEQS